MRGTSDEPVQKGRSPTTYSRRFARVTATLTRFGFAPVKIEITPGLAGLPHCVFRLTWPSMPVMVDRSAGCDRPRSARSGSSSKRRNSATIGNPLRHSYPKLMLSARTLKLLEELCVRSQEVYPEGGTLWTFTEAANQAHFLFRDLRREPPAGSVNLEQLGRWFQGAQGGWVDSQSPVKAESISDAADLISALKEDLRVDEFLWSLDDAGTDMAANIYMARKSDNRYFALKMWWSID